MYAVQILIVITAVYLAPALALRPSLLLKPQTAIAIPFLSVLAVLVLQSLLAQSQLYTTSIVQGCTGLILLVAAIRIIYLFKNHDAKSDWGEFPRMLFMLNIALCIYFGSMLLIHGFDMHDEVYSWNMWAVQHYLGEDIDLYYTQAPYPQLFPKIISYCYMVLGTFESQTAVKTSLIIFPFTIFTALGLASRGNEKKFLLLHVLLCFVLLRELDLKEIFDDGMPDTMAAAAVITSIYMLLLYRRERDSVESLWLALVCAIVAVLAKQHALVWALFSLPVIALGDRFLHREKWSRTFLFFIPAIVAIGWVFTEGRNFQKNSGVTSRSFDGRGVLEQLWFSLDKYFIQEPAIAVVFILAVVSVLRSKRGLDILLAFAIPSIVIWFLFASYDMRAGTPALVVLGFLIAYGNYCLGSRLGENAPIASPMSAALKYVLAFVVMALAFNEAKSKIEKVQSKKADHVVGFSQRNNLIELFGSDANFVFEEVASNKNARLWAPSNYIYGMFYGTVDVTRPSYDNEYDSKTLINEIKSQNRNYAASAGDILPYGPASNILEQVASEKCPKMFTPIAGPDNKYNIILYKINTDLLADGYCDL